MSKKHLFNALDFVADVLEGTVKEAAGLVIKPKKTRKARSPRIQRSVYRSRAPRTVVVHVHAGAHVTLTA